MPVFKNGSTTVLFLHIPKTGGSSIERAFRAAGFSMFLHDGGTKPMSLNNVMHCSPQHWHGEILRQIFRFDAFDYIFTVVRNPVDRIKSEFCFRHRKHKAELQSRFDGWIANTFSRYQSNPFVLDNHIRPQTEFVFEECHSVFRYEEGLGVAMESVSETIGVSLSLPTEKIFSASRSRTAISSAEVQARNDSLELIRHFYSMDFSAFDYG